MSALHTGESSHFQNMILGLNSKVAVPTRKAVKKSLHLKKVEVEKTIKDLLVGKKNSRPWIIGHLLQMKTIQH